MIGPKCGSLIKLNPTWKMSYVGSRKAEKYHTTDKRNGVYYI